MTRRAMGRAGGRTLRRRRELGASTETSINYLQRFQLHLISLLSARLRSPPTISSTDCGAICPK